MNNTYNKYYYHTKHRHKEDIYKILMAIKYVLCIYTYVYTHTCTHI